MKIDFFFYCLQSEAKLDSLKTSGLGEVRVFVHRS